MWKDMQESADNLIAEQCGHDTGISHFNMMSCILRDAQISTRGKNVQLHSNV